jgi:hypothetical protein
MQWSGDAIPAIPKLHGRLRADQIEPYPAVKLKYG